MGILKGVIDEETCNIEFVFVFMTDPYDGIFGGMVGMGRVHEYDAIPGFHDGVSVGGIHDFRSLR